MPPTEVATTGIRVAMASTLTIPKGSLKTDGQQKIVARRNSSASGSPERYFANRTFDGRLRFIESTYSDEQLWPKPVLPMILPETSMALSTSSRRASTKMWMPLSGTRRPTNNTTGLDARLDGGGFAGKKHFSSAPLGITTAVRARCRQLTASFIRNELQKTIASASNEACCCGERSSR